MDLDAPGVGTEASYVLIINGTNRSMKFRRNRKIGHIDDYMGEGLECKGGFSPL